MANIEKQIRPVFTLELNYKIVPGLVTIGKYDGTHPCLTAATTADKVVIHSPHRRSAAVTGRVVWSETNREIATLNINQTITALCAGTLIPGDDKDVLVIGTATHILTYHVHDNKDIFYKECGDGVKALTLGNFKDSKAPIILVGGNSSVHGFDHAGNEMFWTAIGDVVTSLILMDYNKDGFNELIASSEDYNIRVYSGEQIINEHTETEVVTGLVNLPENKFAYSVSNGTIGVYDQDVRLWRVKSKNFAISIYNYDLLGKGTAQLITGWSNGKIDCRCITTGEVLFKDIMPHGIAGIVEGDYRSIGKADLICVSIEGEVRGYTTTKSFAAISGNGHEQETVRELLAQKQLLLQELKHYENHSKGSNGTDLDNQDVMGIPANTRLQISISANSEPKIKNHVEVFIGTNNNTIIKAVIVFGEGIFTGETLVVHPPSSKLNTHLAVPLFPPKDNPVDIHMKILVGFPNSTQFHVFEMTRQLPRFSMYALETTPKAKPDSYVTFKVNERLQRFCMWINQNFLLPQEIELPNEPHLRVNLKCLRDHSTNQNFLLPQEIELPNEPHLRVNLKCLRDHSTLAMVFEFSGKVTIYTNNLPLAADLVQSLAKFLNVESLESEASFPAEEDKLRTYVNKLTEIQDARIKLGTDIADRLRLVRELVIRAEDSRINNLNDMPKYYKELDNVNKDLISTYSVRLSNYDEGLETLKNINTIIQKSSRLRVGQKSSNMINHCRTAIKSNNTEGLIKIIRTGYL
ncbi:Ciliary BBSome complex subunit 2, N-terminal [Popillia japonica]|uniref:Bardet-Biedl syndrome 2 protein homolog n=1 Tax=Popillia japonica TaxID=7064 RepID=A0AAW1LX66_POPJA